MSTIRGTFSLTPRAEEYQPCVWCGAPASFWMDTPRRPDLGQVPCHSMCAAEIIMLYDDFRAGRLLPVDKADQLRRLLA